MAFDEHLVARIQKQLGATEGVAEMKLFGGWCATVAGNMAVGVLGDDLIVRVGADAYDDALQRPGVREFDFGGRPMAGWVFVSATGVTRTRELAAWVDRAVGFARSLPPKQPGSRSRSRPARGS